MSLLLLQAVDEPYAARDAAGAVLPLATLTVYASGTTQLAVPVVTADSAGEFAAVELDAGEYRIELHTADGVLVWACDPYLCDCDAADPIVLRSPINQALDVGGVPYPGATLTFTDAGTGDPLDAYADAALTVPHANPLTANAGGWFPPVYLDDAESYRVVLADADGNVLSDDDPYVCECGSGGDPYWSNVVALLHFDGANGSTVFTDETGKTWSRTGLGTISTDQSVFGGASYANPTKNSTYLETASVADFGYGADDFTIEFRVRFDSVSAGGADVFFDQRNGVNTLNRPTLYLAASGVVRYHVNLADRITGPTLAINTWYAFAVSRVSGTTRMFIDGAQVGSNYVDSTVYEASPVFLMGAGDAPAGPFGSAGYVDELRITKGVGRYVANYVLDTEEFPDFP